MKYYLPCISIALLLGFFIQPVYSGTFKIVYDFNSDLSSNIVEGSEAVSSWNAIPGGTHVRYDGLTDDSGNGVLKLHLTSSNSTNYQTSSIRCDVSPLPGYRIRVTNIKIKHRNGRQHASNYYYRIGCNLNGAIPNDLNDNTQTTGKEQLSYAYNTGSFTPATKHAIVSGDKYVSVFFAATGSGNTGHDFDWLIDEIEINGSYVSEFSLPFFTATYNFTGESPDAVVSGTSGISISPVSRQGGESNGISPNGKYWLKTASNSNSIGYKSTGLIFDITPDEGKEIVLNDYRLVHAGSGETGVSRVNRIGIYRDASRSGSGTEAGRDDFTAYTGRNVYGDNVPFDVFKQSVIKDPFVFSTKQSFTISINRMGSPAQPEYWTIDRIKINGWCVPAGRGELLKVITAGQTLILEAAIGDGAGEYKQEIYDPFYNLLSDAIGKMENPDISQQEIAQLTETVRQAVSGFPDMANSAELTVTINTQAGHPLNEGFAGFNTRIADDPWNYTHPDFIEGCKKMSPGFLRYFSGTSGDYFDMHTGQYELQWFEGTCSNPGTGGDDGSNDDYSSIPDLYKWIEGKGAHSIANFNTLLGELGSKLVVTWNGFYDSPAHAAAFARFCKDNHIVVDCWQFCNEPNFFEAPRRYFWNNGNDYMAKMKEIGDSIRSIFPNANLAPSYGWSFTNDFAQKVKTYQNENNRWWETVSIHAYPTHRGDELFQEGYLTANKSLESHTNSNYFADMEKVGWANANLLITEFGVWNSSLTETLYSAIYIAEYYMRLSRQPQAWMIGKHHIASAFNPVNDFKQTIFNAYTNQTPLNTDGFDIGYTVSSEGYGHQLVNKAFKNSSFVYQTSNNAGQTVPMRSGGTTDGIYTVAYKGINQNDYLLISNKTPYTYNLNILLDNQLLDKTANIEYFYSENPEIKTITTITDSRNTNDIVIYPYSVMRIEWLKDAGTIPSPLAPRIFSVENKQNSVFLKWWKREIAEKYTVHYGTQPGNYTQSIEVTDNAADIQGLTPGQAYYFAVTASNAAGTSPRSNEATGCIRIPEKPVINYIHEDNQRVTIHWESVPFASGYKVSYGTAPGVYLQTIDAGSISGYIFRKLNNNTRYYFTVTAYNGAGESPAANEISGTPVACRPWTPYLVNATEKTDGSVQIAWTPSDSAYNARYNVYYCPTPWDEAHYSLIAENISGTGFSDTTPRKAGTHYYRVKAVNDTGISQFYSQTATVIKKTDTGIAVPQTTKSLKVYPNPAKESVTIELPDNNGDISYRIYSQLGVLTSEGKGNWVSLEKCPHGILILEVFTGKDVQYARIINQ